MVVATTATKRITAEAMPAMVLGLKARQCFCCLSVMSKVRSLQQYRW